MSITAGRTVERALKRILVQASDGPLEPDEYADALDDLNDFMTTLEADGIRLGYTEVGNVADLVTVPRGAVLPIVNNLAVILAPDYSAPVSPKLEQWAAEGMQTLRRLGRAKIRASYPPTLPRGSGNMGQYGHGTDIQFYGESFYGLVALAGNALVTDIEVADTPVKVAGEWRRVDAEGLRTDVAGRIASLKDGKVSATCKFTVTATGDGAYTFHLMHNGQSLATVAATLSSSAADATLTKALDFYPGDHLEIWVEADGHTNDLTVIDAQFEVG